MLEQGRFGVSKLENRPVPTVQLQQFRSQEAEIRQNSAPLSS